jgi:hypothetical protein
MPKIDTNDVKELRGFLYHFDKLISKEDVQGFLPKRITVNSLIEEGFLAHQKSEGESFLRFTTKAIESVMDDAVENPVDAALFWWDDLVERTSNKLNIMEFIFSMCYTHNKLKEFSDDKFDFMHIIGTLLEGREEK